MNENKIKVQSRPSMTSFDTDVAIYEELSDGGIVVLMFDEKGMAFWKRHERGDRIVPSFSLPPDVLEALSDSLMGLPRRAGSVASLLEAKDHSVKFAEGLVDRLLKQIEK